VEGTQNAAADGLYFHVVDQAVNDQLHFLCGELHLSGRGRKGGREGKNKKHRCSAHTHSLLTARPPSLHPSLPASLPPYLRDSGCADVVTNGCEGGGLALLLDEHVDSPRELLDKLVVKLVLRVPGGREGGRERGREGGRERKT